MNDMGADVLMAAMVDGAPQLRGKGSDAKGGYSAIGLLLTTSGCKHLAMRVKDEGWFAVPANMALHEPCMLRVSRMYDIEYDEWIQINHENDVLGWDFLTIAWRHCPNYRTRSESVG